MKKKFKVPVSWMVYGYVNVRADNIDEAIELADEANLPYGEYVEGSFEVDAEMIEEIK